MNICIDISVLTNQMTGVGWTVWEQLRELFFLNNDDKFLLTSPFYMCYQNRLLIEKFVKENNNVHWNKSIALRLYFINRKLNFVPKTRMDNIAQQADIVYYPNFLKPFPPAGKPNLVFIHDLIFMKYPEFYEAKYRNFMVNEVRKSLNGTSCVIVNSECTKNDLHYFFDLPEGKSKVIPLGVSHKYFDTVDRKTSKKILRKYNLDYKKYFTYIGTIEERKNIKGLLHAFNQFCDEHNSQYKLVLIGKKGWGSSEILSCYEGLKFKDRVHFIGYVSEVEKHHILKSAGLFIYPSFYEGFGLSVLEAMACGVPVISSNRSSLPEVCGDAALLVDPNDTTKISNAFYDITSDKSIAEGLVKRGKIRAQQFSWKKNALQLMATMNQVLEGTR